MRAKKFKIEVAEIFGLRHGETDAEALVRLRMIADDERVAMRIRAAVRIRRAIAANGGGYDFTPGRDTLVEIAERMERGDDLKAGP